MSVLGSAIKTMKHVFSAEHLATIDDIKALYERQMPSFTAMLPYAGFDEETETFILEDEMSRAISITVDPISTEGRTGEYLARVRDALEDIYSVFDERMTDQGQWVIQEFTYDDTNISSLMKQMREYVIPHAKGTKFTEEYLKLMEHHLKGINKENGLFRDEAVTGEDWQLRIPRTKLIVYRRLTQSDIKQVGRGRLDPAREVNQVYESIKLKLNAAGVSIQKDNLQSVYRWLFKTFNPSPKLQNFSSKNEFYDRMTDVDGDLLCGKDFCESLFTSNPRSSVEDNCWYFNEKPTRFLRMGGLRTKPRIGQISGEVKTGTGNSAITRCLLDSLPTGTVISKTVVITTQSEFELRFASVGKNSNGQNAESERMKENLKSVRSNGIGDRKKVLCAMGVYVNGKDLIELENNQRKIMTVFNNNAITLFNEEHDGLGLNAYLLHLPMNFKPELDKKRVYLRSMWAQHAANLSLIFGRTEGSGNPCHVYFNRGGAPIFFDPYNKKEKENNSFGFVVGPPGSGKSVDLCNRVYQIMAMKRPRLFIVEYGGSFDVAAEDWEMKGLTVNKMKFSNANPPSLAPYATIDRLLDDPSIAELIDANLRVDQKGEAEEDVVDTSEIDTLGEMELLTFLMITGSELREYENYTRADRALVSKALINTAIRLRKQGIEEGLGKSKPCITQDVIDSIRELANSDDKNISDKQRNNLIEMATSLSDFTQGLKGKLFNRVGQAWPDADITLVNLGTLSSPSNKDMLSVAYTSLMQHVNNLAESTQFDERDVVVLTDESHLLTGDEMLSKLIVKQVKTSRKYGCWPTFATQNVSDMSGEAEKLLSQIEWYFCLNFSISEAELVSKYKTLSDERKQLLTSTRKMSGTYTEGVVISGKNDYLFRSVLPSLILAVSASDSEEKAARRKLVRDRNLSCDLEGSYEIANDIDKSRGINARLEFSEMAGSAYMANMKKEDKEVKELEHA